MSLTFDVAAIGNAIVDVIAPAEDSFLVDNQLAKGAMTLIDEAQAEALYERMAAGLETSGGSAGNTVAGVASFGGRAAYLGKVADDQLGQVFAHDTRAIGVHFETAPLVGGPATGRSLINVTPDGQRTMCTFLGASNQLSAADIDPAVIEGAAIVYLEGYLFDPSEARRAFAKAAGLARASARMIAITLSDAFVVERHRRALLEFIETEVDLVFANEAEITSLYEVPSFDDAGRPPNFARQYDAVGGDHRLTGDAGVRIGGEEGVDHLVGNAVGHLVRVALRNAFAGEQVALAAAHAACPWAFWGASSRTPASPLAAARSASRASGRGP